MKHVISIEDYLSEISKYNSYKNVFYRGQSDSAYKNISCGIVRDDGFKINESKIIYDTLRNKSKDFMNLNLPIEHLSKMQHYGIPTRLIDVSLSPLIALYFAVENIDNFQDGEVFIFIKNSYELYSKEVKVNSLISELDLYEVGSIKKKYEEIYEEKINEEEILNTINQNIFVTNSEELIKTNERLYKQQGTFVICGNRVNRSEIQKDILSISKDEAANIIRIPFEYKESIKRELDYKYKINESYVYPELTSFARYIREKYKEENINLEDAYEIVKEDDTSFAKVRRKEKYIILKRKLRINDIQEIVSIVIRENKDTNDVLWIYVARNKEDLIMHNWIVQAIWINSDLDENYRPSIVGKLDENNISWNLSKDFSSLNEYYNKSVFEDDKILFIYNQKSYELLKKIYNKLLVPFKRGELETFLHLLNEYGRDIREEYLKFGDYGHSKNIDFDKYLDNYQSFAANIDNLVICLHNSDENNKYLYDIYIRETSKYIKIIDNESLFWREKLEIIEADFDDINYVKKDVVNIFKPTIPINKKGLDVKFDIEIVKLNDNRVQIKGWTNLFDKASLMLKVGGEDYHASDTVVVENNEFLSNIFSNKGEGLSSGEYLVEIILPISAVQDKRFVNKAGMEYENLMGDFINRSGFGPTGEYKHKFYL